MSATRGPSSGPSSPAPKPVDSKAVVYSAHMMLYGNVHQNPAKCGQHTLCKKCNRRHPCPARN